MIQRYTSFIKFLKVVVHFLFLLKSSVQILGLIKEILPHIAALNQLYTTKEQTSEPSKLCIKGEESAELENVDFGIHKNRNDDTNTVGEKPIDNCTTSNHYCVVESEHPYRSASINCFK